MPINIEDTLLNALLDISNARSLIEIKKIVLSTYDLKIENPSEIAAHAAQYILSVNNALIIWSLTMQTFLQDKTAELNKEIEELEKEADISGNYNAAVEKLVLSSLFEVCTPKNISWIEARDFNINAKKIYDYCMELKVKEDLN